MDEDLAGGEGFEAGYELEEGGFSAAGGADEGDELASGDLEVDGVKDGRGRGGEALGCGGEVGARGWRV